VSFIRIKNQTPPPKKKTKTKQNKKNKREFLIGRQSCPDQKNFRNQKTNVKEEEMVDSVHNSEDFK
jgi:hypothetical protein